MSLQTEWEGTMGEGRIGGAQVRRAANERIRSMAAEIGAEAESQEWTFFCECGVSGCRETVRLGLEAFDRLVADRDASLLAPRHRAPAAPPLRTFRCARCGYGACCREQPGQCPMCRRSEWLEEEREPAARSPGSRRRASAGAAR
jgi:hypothetical protein